MRRIYTTLLAIAVIASSALFGFADTADSIQYTIQYTTDKSNTDSYITYDSENMPTFIQNQKVYIRIVEGTEDGEGTDGDAGAGGTSGDATSGSTSENGDNAATGVNTGSNSVAGSNSSGTGNSSAGSSSGTGSSGTSASAISGSNATGADSNDASNENSSDTADGANNTDASASPTLLQRTSGSEVGESLTGVEDGFYQINTEKLGTYELVLDDEVVMAFRVKAQAGVIYRNKAYYYQDENGVIRTTVGFLRWNGRLYYVQKGGKIAAGKTFKVGKYTYRAASNGQIKTGVYKWGKYYYYSSSNGRLKTSKGFVSSGGHLYYVRKGGKIQTSKTFKIGKYTYRAAGNGQIKTGVYKWGKYYYYSSSKGRLKKSKGFVTSGGHRYYVRKGGKIIVSKTFKVGKYTYRAASNGQIKTGVYKWGSYYYYSSSSGVLRKKAGLISWNGKKYYSRSNGTLYTSRFFFANSVMYYAGSNGACQTGTFKVGSYTYTADSTGAISSSDRKYMLGVDVSYWQGSNINWSKVKASGISFAFLRCGYTTSDKGARQVDSTFQTNIKNATSAGLDVGAYYLTQAVTEAEAKAEAKLAIQQVQASGCPLNLPLVVDTENVSGRASSAKFSKAKRTAIVTAFCETVKAAGYTPMIYASTSWLNNNLDMSKLSAYKVWVAQYSDSVSYSGAYQCWQYSCTGTVSGISGKVDLNYWTL